MTSFWKCCFCNITFGPEKIKREGEREREREGGPSSLPRRAGLYKGEGAPSSHVHTADPRTLHPPTQSPADRLGETRTLREPRGDEAQRRAGRVRRAAAAESAGERRVLWFCGSGEMWGT